MSLTLTAIARLAKLPKLMPLSELPCAVGERALLSATLGGGREPLGPLYGGIDMREGALKEIEVERLSPRDLEELESLGEGGPAAEEPRVSTQSREERIPRRERWRPACEPHGMEKEHSPARSERRICEEPVAQVDKSIDMTPTPINAQERSR